MDPGLPDLFNSFRERGIKMTLNTGYSVDIQEALIENLNMRISWMVIFLVKVYLVGVQNPS